jgi:hypothetical protein
MNRLTWNGQVMQVVQWADKSHLQNALDEIDP